MDLTVAVTPLYFGSMAWEQRALKKRTEVYGPSAADYLKPDTITSLGMGVLSISTPLTVALASYVVPFRTGTGRGRSGRIGQVVVGIAITAAAATAIADAVANRADIATDAGRRAKARARSVAEVSSVAAFAAGGIALTATTASLTGMKRMWRKGNKRDMGAGVLPWTIAMVWWDLAYYWNHRVMHEVRGM